MQNLTKKQIENIQFDEALVYVNWGVEGKERMIGPSRGGGEFVVTETIRDVEFDGRQGKTKDMQVLEDQGANLKIVSLCCTQEDLELALVGGKLNEDQSITNIQSGSWIPATKYLENVVAFAKLSGGTFKKITIFNALHESGMTFSTKPKAENEHNLDFIAHFDPTDRTKNIYKVEDIESIPATGVTTSQTGGGQLS